MKHKKTTSFRRRASARLSLIGILVFPFIMSTSAPAMASPFVSTQWQVNRPAVVAVSDQSFNLFVQDEVATQEVLDELDKVVTEQVEIFKREEAERERAEAEQRAREEAERKAKEEAERKAREEAERKAREEAERKAKEEAERKAKACVMPLDPGFRFTSEFGPRWGKMHTGLDMADDTGTKVMAVKSGKIISAGYFGAYGNQVMIKHNDGETSSYSHLSKITASGSVGAGDKIGEVGDTGNSTGPHLHLEINGGATNPRGWLDSCGAL